MATGRNVAARNRMGTKLAKLDQEEPKEQKDWEHVDIIKISAPRTLDELYAFDEKIYDAGDRSKVFLARDKKTDHDVVIKMRRKGFFSGGERVWRQVLTRIMNIERNDHILGVDKILEDESAYYVVMEKCHGGELFDFLLNETDVPERECKRIMREILKAIDHIHSKGLIHRDIKPENLLFQQSDNTADRSPRTIKLIDFDTCQDWTPESPKAQRIVGTPGYIAPESFRGDYTPASDLWSVGVILYILMTGDMPFGEEVFGDDIAGNNVVGGAKMEAIYDRLKDAKVDFSCAPWPDFPQARDLCQQLLAFDPGDRSPSAAAALNHPWLTE
eukprot:GEMP01018233.1.p1 GENE.GEMP01018233.1~~GEMP01018233.1.p1  ORF type:complete len:330 (+),score=81.39 GEMP01018233.1:229-1218(+)